MKHPSMSRLIHDFETFNRAKNLSPGTISFYSRKLKDFRRSFSGDPLRVSPKTVREYVAGKIAKGLSASTARSYFVALQGFYSFLVADGVIKKDSSNPMRRLSPPRVPQKPIEPLNEGQVLALLGSFNVRQPEGYRDYRICALLLDSGLRANEAAGLKVDNIDWANHRLKVLGKGSRSRWVYIGHTVTKLLREYLEGHRPNPAGGDGVLFLSRTGHPLRHDIVSKMVTRHLDKVGIPRIGLSAHRLRHTFAITFLRNGGGVFTLQKILGHSTLDMTRRYCLIADDDAAEAHKKAGPIDKLWKKAGILPAGSKE